jgi:hypothetical protein
MKGKSRGVVYQEEQRRARQRFKNPESNKALFTLSIDLSSENFL